MNTKKKYILPTTEHIEGKMWELGIRRTPYCSPARIKVLCAAFSIQNKYRRERFARKNNLTWMFGKYILEMAGVTIEGQEPPLEKALAVMKTLYPKFEDEEVERDFDDTAADEDGYDNSGNPIELPESDLRNRTQQDRSFEIKHGEKEEYTEEELLGMVSNGYFLVEDAESGSKRLSEDFQMIQCFGAKALKHLGNLDDIRASRMVAEILMKLDSVSKIPGLKGSGGVKRLSKEKERGILKGPEDLFKATMTGLASSALGSNYFLYKTLNQSIRTRERKFERLKKEVNVALDISGSMDMPERLLWVGCLMKIFKGLIDKEVCLNLYAFGSNVIFKRYEITDLPKTLLELSFKRRFLNDCTSTGKCMREIFTDVHERFIADAKTGSKPVLELVVITDEDASVKDFKHPLMDEARIHGIALSENKWLQTLCDRTKGAYFSV